MPLRLWDTGTGASNTNVLEFAHATGSSSKLYVPGARVKSINPASGATTGANLILETASLSNQTTTTWNSNQLYLKNDGKIGIGSSTPTSYLTINTPGGSTYNGGSTGDHAIMIGSQSTGFIAGQLGTDETLGVVYIQSAIRGGAATPILLNAQGGNIGIGVTSPAAKLHAVTNVSTIPLIIASGSTTVDLIRLTQVGTGNVLVVEDSTNPDLTPFVIQADGKVVIGTSSTVANLEVRATGANGILLGPDLGSLTSSSRLFFSNGVAGQHTAILNTAGDIDFRTDGTVNSATGTSRMVIERTTGNVGIAQSSPLARLHVEPSATGIAIVATGSSTQDLVRLTQVGTGNVLVVEDSTNPDSTPFVITNDGKTRIGTTAPSSYNASLYSVSGTDYGIEAYGPVAGIISRGMTYGLVATATTDGHLVAGIVASATNDQLAFGTYIGGIFTANPSDSFMLAYSVRLQDGTEGVGKVLVSQDASGSANWNSDISLTSLIVESNLSTNLVRITQTGTGNALVVEDSTNPDSTPFVVSASGNVGVGTASPSNKLSIVSTSSGAIRIVDGTQQNGYVLTSDANGVGTWQAPGGGSLLGTTNYFPYYSSTTTLSSTSSIYQTGGLVGIGTTTPSVELEVNGDLKISGTFSGAGVGSNAAYATGDQIVQATILTLAQYGAFM